MSIEYVVKLADGTDVKVEVRPEEMFFEDGGYLYCRDANKVLQWAYAPGQWKSVHRVVPTTRMEEYAQAEQERHNRVEKIAAEVKTKKREEVLNGNQVVL